MLREVKKCGNSGHIIFPKQFIGKTIEIQTEGIIPEDKEFMTKKEIKKLIGDEIYAAKQGYN